MAQLSTGLQDTVLILHHPPVSSLFFSGLDLWFCSCLIPHSSLLSPTSTEEVTCFITTYKDSYSPCQCPFSLTFDPYHIPPLQHGHILWSYLLKLRTV